MSILTINAGSSSLKFGLFDAEATDLLAWGSIDWTGDPQRTELVVRQKDGAEQKAKVDVSDPGSAVAHAVRAIAETQSQGIASIQAVGHRVVHGGVAFRDSVGIDAGVKGTIGRLAELAPLHNPAALEAIEAAQAALPAVPHVAVFDTAFFSTLAPAQFIYPLPYQWYADWGIRRFGFHGISHAYCAMSAAALLGKAGATPRLVICHLGNGCSASAVKDGAAVATSMGFTPMEGLMMGSRSGSVDPGALLYLQRQRGLTAEQMDQTLNHGSGLLGISGISSDFRQVEHAAQQGHERARLALDIYAQRVQAVIGSLTVTIGGIDALVFTAGVGENSASLRQAACRNLGCLGLHLDSQRNDSCRPDIDIAASDSPGRILVLHTREDLMIARETRRIASGQRS